VTLSQRKPVRIGRWVADPATNELRNAGRSVRLEPKPMDLLMRLAAQPGEVVSRETLLQEVWSDAVVVDEALTQAVARLRKALGDDGDYVETLSKRGYRLTVPVQPVDAPGAAPRRPRLVAATIAALLLVVGIVAYVLTNDPPAPSPATAERRDGWMTVTVMPFETLSPNAGQDYLARGMSDTLMTELGHLSGLRVTTAGGR
jgi:DNA-binding winged helix-turn-helix (wHTH) protein